ncbi:hypothetical protein V2J09_014267 [Rumex salicifolius]
MRKEKVVNVDFEGQKTSTNPAAKLSFLTSKRKKLLEELRNVEKQVYELETTYLQDSTLCGNVFKGFEGSLSSSKTGNKGQGNFNPKIECSRYLLLPHQQLKKRELDGMVKSYDSKKRLFFIHSCLTGTLDIATGRTKGGGLPANGGGKPRKGRLAPRDGRRLKLTSHAQNEDDGHT